jgi:hypothetical protein
MGVYVAESFSGWHMFLWVVYVLLKAFDAPAVSKRKLSGMEMVEMWGGGCWVR